MKSLAHIALALLALVAVLVAEGGGEAQASPAKAAVFEQKARHLAALSRLHRRLARRSPGGKAARRHGRKARTYRRRAASLRRKARKLRRKRIRRVKSAAVPRPAPPPPRGPPRALGAAVDWQEFALDPALASTFLRHFDGLTAENEMKMYALQPAAGQFDFREADEMVNWALAAGKRVRGHTLVWGNQLPWWVQLGIWTPETLRPVMRDHIRTVMQHFDGRVREWDVVNEAIGSDGKPMDNVWLRTLGPGYVEEAFRAARAADPDAKLFYNDNGIDLPDDPHTKAVLRMVADFKRRGVPIDGVGIQNHVSTRYNASYEQMAEVMRRFRALGVEVAVTEMDVRKDSGGGPAAETARQAHVYGQYAKACRLEPRCGSFTVWGVGDRYSWYTNPTLEPLLFDKNLRAKPAYTAVSDWLRRP